MTLRYEINCITTNDVHKFLIIAIASLNEVLPARLNTFEDCDSISKQIESDLLLK